MASYRYRSLIEGLYKSLIEALGDYSYTVAVCEGAKKDLCEKGCLAGLAPIVFTTRADASSLILNALNGGRPLSSRGVPGVEVLCPPVFKSTWSMRTVQSEDRLHLSPVLAVGSDEEKYPRAWVLDVPMQSEGGYVVTLDATPLPIYRNIGDFERYRGVVESILGSPELETMVTDKLRAQEVALESWNGSGGKRTIP